jgi:uncharacterized protein (DUF2225 family)
VTPKEDGVDISTTALACPLCLNHFSHPSKTDNRNAPIFGYGLDFRIVPRDCDRGFDVATCPTCFFTSRVEDFPKRVPGQIKDKVRSAEYVNLFKSCSEDSTQARSWIALVSLLALRGLNPRDLGVISLRGSWVARETNSLGSEEHLLVLTDKYLDEALRRGLTNGDPGMAMYLLGEINRRRGEFLRAKEMLTFLGNNPRYRYAALLLTVLIEEEDSTPYWSRHAPDRMEQHSPRFRGLFPALRSIPPGKTEFYPDELSETSEQPD